MIATAASSVGRCVHAKTATGSTAPRCAWRVCCDTLAAAAHGTRSRVASASTAGIARSPPSRRWWVRVGWRPWWVRRRCSGHEVCISQQVVDVLLLLLDLLLLLSDRLLECLDVSCERGGSARDGAAAGHASE